MKKRVLSVLAILISLSSYSQNVNKDSLNRKKVYIQLDLPGLLWLDDGPTNFQGTSKYTVTYRPSINFTAGYSFKKDIAKKIKKSVQLNVLYYTHNELIEAFSQTNEISSYYSRMYSSSIDRSTYLSISPELKLLVNKKTYKYGFYGTIGAGYSQQKIYGENNELFANKTGWNLLGSAGYLITTRKKIYFDFNWGLTSFFVCKSINLKVYQTDNLTEDGYYNFIQYNYPVDGLTSVTFIDSNTVQYNYKTAGLSSYKLIPRMGVAIGIRF